MFEKKVETIFCFFQRFSFRFELQYWIRVSAREWQEREKRKKPSGICIDLPLGFTSLSLSLFQKHSQTLTLSLTHTLTHTHTDLSFSENKSTYNPAIYLQCVQKGDVLLEESRNLNNLSISYLWSEGSLSFSVNFENWTSKPHFISLFTEIHFMWLQLILSVIYCDQITEVSFTIG